MFKELVEALYQALQFRGIPPKEIDRLDANVGFIWFKAGDYTYCIDIKKVGFDLDEYAREQSQP